MSHNLSLKLALSYHKKEKKSNHLPKEELTLKQIVQQINLAIVIHLPPACVYLSVNQAINGHKLPSYQITREIEK